MDILQENNKPMVSVIVLTYNQEETIERTLMSILAQKTDFKYQLIIGEDCSTDNTRSICEKIQSLNENIYILPKSLNKGVLKNFEECCEHCTGKYIAVCAGDDWWHNDHKLKLQVDYLEHNSKCGVVFTDFNIHYADDNVYTEDINKNKGFNPPSDIYKKLLIDNFIITPSVMIRLELIKSFVSIEEYRKNNFMMEDYPMWLELSQHCRFHYLPVSTISYTIKNGSISNNNNNIDRMINYLDNITLIKNYFLKKYPVTDLSGLELNQCTIDNKFSIYVSHNDQKKAIKEVSKLKCHDIKFAIKYLLCINQYTFKLYRYFILRRQNKKG